MHIEIINDHIISFETFQEDMHGGNVVDYLMKECGWTRKKAKECEDHPFFVAKVSLFKASGEEIESEYLGACIYKETDEFFTKYRTDCFSDMVSTLFSDAGIPLSEEDKAKHGLLRAKAA